MKKLIVIIIVLAGVGAGLGAYYMRRNTKEPKCGRRGQPRRRRAGGAGHRHARGPATVEVGSQVSGIVQELYADFNSIVKKGQVIARLDSDHPRHPDRTGARERRASRRRISTV
jgi:HlyD family secretion protein